MSRRHVRPSVAGQPPPGGERRERWSERARVAVTLLPLSLERARPLRAAPQLPRGRAAVGLHAA
eukprot:scaffold451_cov365-Prasinococcus_capsulatus_cf.AAC.6